MKLPNYLKALLSFVLILKDYAKKFIEISSYFWIMLVLVF